MTICKVMLPDKDVCFRVSKFLEILDDFIFLWFFIYKFLIMCSDKIVLLREPVCEMGQYLVKL